MGHPFDIGQKIGHQFFYALELVATLYPAEMFVITLAAFIVVPDEANPISAVEQAVLQSVWPFS